MAGDESPQSDEKNANPRAESDPASNVSSEISTGTIVAGPEHEPTSDPGPLRPIDHNIGTIPRELTASGHYTDVRELGRGGMGVVYLARNVMMNRLEVLKIIDKSQLDWPGAVDRFVREIRSAAKLRHPNVVGAFSAQHFGELLVFAMEYVDGIDLGKLLKTKGPLPIPNACYYVYQAALGLQHAFERQMVHRDIKPSNLILTREGKKQVVKVLDFGLAKGTGEKGHEDGYSTTGKVVLCTPDYVAPEQIDNASRTDIRSDIYSLGCTLYYLLSGRLPFEGKNVYEILAAHKSRKARPLAELRKEIPDALSSTVAKMMAKDPAHRFQSPADVAAALKTFFLPGMDVEIVPTSIVLTPVVERAVSAEPLQPPERKKSTTKVHRAALVDEATPTRRRSRKTVKPVTTGVMIARFVCGILVLALFIAWSAGAFKSKPREEKVSAPNAAGK